jgi:ABC-2 type transport system ATP-binding protein
MDVIETRKLTKYYGKSRGIINLDLDIQEGEIFGFIGPNGAGKSTTIRTLLNFIFPTSGTATIFGMDCVRDSARIKKEVGYIPSEVNYYDDMKVIDLLEYSASFYCKDCSNRIKQLGEAFDVEMDKKIEDLSAGNKKKVAIVQALLHEPKLLILDEPTGGLDPLMQNRFFEVLKEENRRGATIFFSSHILGEVQKMCDRVAIIREGRILKIERVQDLRSAAYKKVKVEFRDRIAEGFKIEGMTGIKTNGHQMSFLFSGKMDSLIGKLSELPVANMWLEEPELEEVFIHYYERGEEQHERF